MKNKHVVKYIFLKHSKELEKGISGGSIKEAAIWSVRDAQVHQKKFVFTFPIKKMIAVKLCEYAYKQNSCLFPCKLLKKVAIGAIFCPVQSSDCSLINRNDLSGKILI